MKRDSNYCVAKYGYLKKFDPENYKQIDELMCYHDLSFPFRKDECELVNSKIWKDYLDELSVEWDKYLEKRVGQYRFDMSIEK